MNGKIILAIDPGYDRCGVAIVEIGKPSKLIKSFCITTDKKSSQEKRLAQIFEELVVLIKKYKPKYLAVETLFFSVNKKTAMKVSESRGVVVLLAGLYDIELIELSPQEVKLSMAGTGGADKKQLQKMVAITLKIDIKGKLDDEIDAIALGFAGVGFVRFKSFRKQ